MLESPKGILFDMDGVVHVGDTPIAGAADVMAYLGAKNIPFRFLTNTTTKPREQLHAMLSRMNLPVAPEQIFTTHEVAAAWLRDRGRPACHLLVADATRDAYADIPQSDKSPEYIVIGDIGDRWSYALLNRVFNMIMDGAEMLALHKGRYWKTEAGLQMDIGAFVAGLEYTTGKTATVVGKPSPAFFEAPLADMGLDRQSVVMVGDDIETDVGGAQDAGIRGVLVKTGKYREDAVARSSVKPDAVIFSVAELLKIL